MTMAAPVVPTHEASIVPIKSRTVLSAGVPFSEPRMTIPPAMVKSPHKRIIKGI